MNWVLIPWMLGSVALCGALAATGVNVAREHPLKGFLCAILSAGFGILAVILAFHMG